MYVPSNSPKYTCQKCRTKIPMDDLEAVFHEQVKAVLTSDEEIAALLDDANKTVREKTELLAVLEKEFEKLTRESDKLYDLYQSGMIDKAGFGKKYKPLSERRDQLENQLAELQAEVDILKISRLSQAHALDGAKDLHARWPTLAKEDKRQIVEAMVEKITIGDGEVEIALYYTPPPAGGTGNSAPPKGSFPSETSFQNHGKKATNGQGLQAATS